MKKDRVKKLQKQADALCNRHNALASENSELKKRADVLEDLLKQRNALVCVLERVDPDSMAAAISVTQQHDVDSSTQQLLQQLPQQPMASSLTSIDRQLVAQIMALTPAKAVDFWVAAVQQLALLMHMYERDPLPVLPALSEAVVSCMRWQLALHIFNPGVAYALLDFNMLLGKHVAPPAEHWSKAASAGNLTPDQLQSIGTLLGLVKPRLQQLEQEKEALLEELSSLPGGYEEEQDMAAAAAAGHRPGPAHSASSSSSATSNSSSSGGNITAATQRRKEVQRRRQELTAALTRNCAAWRVTTQMRAHWLSSNCTPAQLAIGILQAFPYMPHGAPVLDCSKLLADKLKQKQQEQRKRNQQHAQQLQQQLQQQHLDSMPSAMGAEGTAATAVEC